MMVLKLGGSCVENDQLIIALAGELKVFHERGEKILLVHGGGKTISEVQSKYNQKSQFINGLRQTGSQEMPLVDMALAGAVNKKLVRLFYSQGIQTWGLSGADACSIIGQSIDGDKSHRTGSVRRVSTEAISLMWNAGYFPVLAPPSMDDEGMGLNINADEVALAFARELRARCLIFLSDVPGILQGGKLLPRIRETEADALVANETITAGMIPKIQSSVAALHAGVGAVIIASYQSDGDFNRILTGDLGTQVILRDMV